MSDVWVKTVLPIIGTIATAFAAHSFKLEVMKEEGQVATAGAIQRVSLSFVKACQGESHETTSEP